MKKINLILTPRRNVSAAKVRDDALEALSGVSTIEKAQGHVGWFGNIVSRNFKWERIFDKKEKRRQREMKRRIEREVEELWQES